MKFAEYTLPFRSFSKMMQNGGGTNEVKLRFARLQLSNVTLKRGYFACGRLADTFNCPVQHRTAQVNQSDVKVGQQLQNLERIVAGTTANIQKRRCSRRDAGGCASDQCKRQRGVNRGGLPGLEIGKTFNFAVKTLSNLFYG